MNWKDAAEICEVDYGCYVNWKERYFICPECGEPVYADDYDGFYPTWDMCPICDFNFVEGE